MRAEQSRRVRWRALGRSAVLLLASCSVFPDQAVLPGNASGGSAGASGGPQNAGGKSGGSSGTSGGERWQGGAGTDAGAPSAGEAGMSSSGGRANTEGGSAGSGATSAGNGALGGAGGSGTCSTPSTAKLEAAADTYVSELPSDKKVNFGQGTTVRVGGIADGRLHTLVAFDLSPLAAATNVVRATLRLRLATPSASPTTVFAYALSQPFVEEQATWERFTQSTKWLTPGGDTAVSASSSSAVSAGTAAGTAVEFELGGDVNAILRGQRPNNGWLLAVSDGEPALELVSRESAFSDERPMLEVLSCP